MRARRRIRVSILCVYGARGYREGDSGNSLGLEYWRGIAHCRPLMPLRPLHLVSTGQWSANPCAIANIIAHLYRHIAHPALIDEPAAAVCQG
jgi:hypothetical protein